jgi:hypothetical protein
MDYVDLIFKQVYENSKKIMKDRLKKKSLIDILACFRNFKYTAFIRDTIDQSMQDLIYNIKIKGVEIKNDTLYIKYITYIKHDEIQRLVADEETYTNDDEYDTINENITDDIADEDLTYGERMERNNALPGDTGYYGKTLEDIRRQNIDLYNAVMKIQNMKVYPELSEDYSYVKEQLTIPGQVDPLWDLLDNKYTVINCFSGIKNIFKKRRNLKVVSSTQKLSILFVCLRKHAYKTFKFLMNFFMMYHIKSDTYTDFINTINMIMEYIIENPVQVIEFMTVPSFIYANGQLSRFVYLLQSSRIYDIDSFIYTLVFLMHQYSHESLDQLFIFTCEFYGLQFSKDMLNKYNIYVRSLNFV